MPKSVSENDSLVLIDKKGKRIILTAKDGAKKIKGLGVYNPGELLGKGYGEKVLLGNREFTILNPSIFDKISSIERKAQIILPKDGMFIIFYCDIKSGDWVVEGGTGSGAMTILLANAVMPNGRIISYEKRNDFANQARKNVERARLKDIVKIKKGDITETISEKNVDAVVLDIPNPWDALGNASAALKLGGHLATYSPTVNQVERTVKDLRKHGFTEIRTLETLQREIVVGERGTRPSFDTLGHTGYVTVCRKANE